VIDSVRALGPTLVVDTGDFLGTPDKAYGYDTDLMLVVMRMIGYDAVTIGESDLRRGLDYIKDAAARGGFPIVAANLFRAGEPRVRPFAPYLIKKVGKTRYGIIGVLGKEDRGANFSQYVWLDPGMMEKEKIVVTDPIVAIKDVLPEVRKRSDVVVILAHTGLERAKEIATLVPGVDVVVSGHGPNALAAPEKPGAVLAMCGQRSDKLGTLRVVSENGEITSHSGTTITLNQDKSPINSKVRTVVFDALSLDEFGNKKSTTTIRAGADSSKAKDAAAEIPEAPVEDTTSRLDMKGAHYLGTNSCKDCHVSQWAQWSGTKHATAYQTLANGDDWNNHACLPCHVTGYAMLGGHSTSSLSPDLWGVQCEECHGMGTDHAISGVEVAEASCLKCHTKDQDPDFDFAKAIVNVIH